MTITHANTTKKRKSGRMSKNKKKSWKKYDISEIEDALDKERLELRTGGLVKDKIDSELFVIDQNAVKPSLKRKREKRLMVDRMITPNPEEIPPSNRNAAKLRREARKILYLEKIGKPLKKKIPFRAIPRSKKEVRDLDIWAKDIDEFKDKFFSKSSVQKHTERITRISQQSRPKHLDKKSPFNCNPVEVAHPGSSYNPTLDDHQNLLLKEHEREVKKVKVATRIERAIAIDPDEIATAATRKAEVEEGLFPSDGSEDEEEKPAVPIFEVQNRRKKTAKDRRNARKQLRQVQRKATKKMNNIRNNEVYRIKKIKAEIVRKEKRQAELRAIKAKIKKEKRPVLSSTKYKEPDHDLKLSSEIKGTLRQLKPEGNVLFDRYNSYKKRCLIAPCSGGKKRRANKQKWVEKREFKAIEI